MIELHGKLSIKRLSGMVNLVHVKASDDMLQAKTVTPSTSQQVVTPDTGSGYTALSRVTVEAVKLQNKTVKPGSAAQAVQADDGSTGLGIVTVEAAPLQEITAEIAAEIQHLVPDPGFYGFSGVTIKALPDAETAAFCESVSLPVIPEDVLEALPFAVIGELTADGTTIYLLAAAESAFFYGPGSIIGQSYDKFLGSLGAGTLYYTTADGTSWTKAADGPAGNMVMEMDESTRVVYSNHDIYQVEADDSGELSVDILYYAKSGLYGVAISDAYRIQRETLEDLGDQVNRLTGTAESMTPARMTQKLEGLNIQLEELTVVATEEVQTITPPSGVYGFSKVIVEAVEEDSGSTGGGTGPGTGGGEGGDDPGPEYSSIEDSELTYAETEMDVPTGRYFYGNCPQSLPACPVKYSNQVLVYTTSSNQRSMYQCAVGFYRHEQPVMGGSPSYTIRPRGFPQICARYNYNSETDSWDFAGEANYNYIVSTGCYWANHTILTNYDDSVYKEGTSPVPETESTTTYAPTGTDAVYTMTGDTVTDLGATVYQITGVQAANPEEMIDALNYYAAILETA